MVIYAKYGGCIPVITYPSVRLLVKRACHGTPSRSGYVSRMATKPNTSKNVQTGYSSRLSQTLKSDAHRPKRDRRTALKLFEEIQKQGFAGNHSRVTEFTRKWREGSEGVSAKSAFVPLKFQLGEALTELGTCSDDCNPGFAFIELKILPL